MFYAICSTKKNDVAACVKEMKKQGTTHTLYQLSATNYKKAEAERTEVLEIVGKMFPRHSITIQNGTLHRKMCKKVTTQNSVLAAISRPSLTGLRMCSCMK